MSVVVVLTLVLLRLGFNGRAVVTVGLPVGALHGCAPCLLPIMWVVIRVEVLIAAALLLVAAVLRAV